MAEALFLRQLEHLQKHRALQQHPFDPPLGPPGSHARPAPPSGHDRPNEATFPVAVSGLSDAPFMDAGGTTACILENFIPYHFGLCPRMGLKKIGATGSAATSSLLFPFENGMLSQFLAVQNSKLVTIAPESGVVTDTMQATRSNDISGVGIFGEGAKLVLLMNGQETILYDPTQDRAEDKISRLAMGNNAGQVNGANPDKWLSATSYRNHIFVVDGSSTAYQLPLLSVAGEVEPLELGGVLPNAASVVMVDSWSMVAGDALQQRLAFFTDDGHVAVYAGAVSELELQGVFSVGHILSRNCKFQHVTDLMVGTTSGLLSMNGLISGHPEPYISTSIERLWRTKAMTPGAGWGAFKWQDRNLAFVFDGATVLGINLENRAWFEFSYGDIQPVAFAPLGSKVFMTDADGTFYELAGGDDAKETIHCTFRMTPVAFPVNTGRVQMRAYWSGPDLLDDKASSAANAEQDVPEPAPVYDRQASTAIFGKSKLGRMRLGAGQPVGGGISTGWQDMERSFDAHGGNLHLFAPTFQVSTKYPNESNAVIGSFAVRMLTARGGA